LGDVSTGIANGAVVVDDQKVEKVGAFDLRNVGRVMDRTEGGGG
jgi:hypothetical protein